MLTCLHVMGSLMLAKGIDASVDNLGYSGRELPTVVTGAFMYDTYASNWMAALLGRASSMLYLPNARTKEPEPFSSRDIAAFIVEGAARITPLHLAEGVPSAGQPIWLAVNSRGKRTERTFAATVVEQTDRTLIYRFLDDVDALPHFTSGAPLLSAAGEVVGLNVGIGTLDGRTYGHANHVVSIRCHLGQS